MIEKRNDASLENPLKSIARRPRPSFIEAFDNDLLEAKMVTEEDYKHQIYSDTFTPTEKRLGMGCWGIVDVYKDMSEQDWAIKMFNPNEIAQRQMQERNWTEEDVMRREAVPLSAAHRHTVPRLIERDKLGRMYVAMPVYNEGDFSNHTHYSLEENLKIIRDVADSLDYLHSELNRAHGDVKPANILLDKGRGFLGDLGSSTCISIGSDSRKVRGQFGDENYRAPEVFEKGDNAEPDKRTDIWSLGALTYKKIVGEGIYDDLNPENITQKQINKKIKKAPRKLRKLLKGCLRLNRYERYDARQVMEESDKLLRTPDRLAQFGRASKLVALAAAIAIPISAMVASIENHEPTELNMPKSKIQGILYLDANKDQKPIEFESEDLENLPDAYGGGMIQYDRPAKQSTDNRVVAYLGKCHAQAMDHCSGLFGPAHLTDYQFDLWGQHRAMTGGGPNPWRVSQYWDVMINSIEQSLTQAQKDSKVDLEDVCAITRLGPNKVMEAKRIADSQNWKDYQAAKLSNGEYVIPEKEQTFVNQWIACIHADK